LHPRGQKRGGRERGEGRGGEGGRGEGRDRGGEGDASVRMHPKIFLFN
jgi:hypothetical protein